MVKIQRSGDRGSGDYGWLKTRYSFSFANYYNPDRMGFGALCVINDDSVQAGNGFDFHSHDNMEIITIPLSGALLHKDTMGNSEVVSAGEVQVMSAGSGVTHSEWNASENEPVELLQIWVRPNKDNVAPRYDQMVYAEGVANEWQTLVSPHPSEEGLWIYQDAWLCRGQFEEGFRARYDLNNPGHGVYLFVIHGEVEVVGEVLGSRDAVEITGEKAVQCTFYKPSDVLLIEVPVKEY